jgi:hypothetical protein
MCCKEEVLEVSMLWSSGGMSRGGYAAAAQKTIQLMSYKSGNANESGIGERERPVAML